MPDRTSEAIEGESPSTLAASDDKHDPVRSIADRRADAAEIVRWYAPTTIAICLLVAIAARRYVADANADALLPSLMSTQQWTVFYWGQDRLFNLVPLIAMPIRDPVWNFQIQTLVIGAAFFGVGAMFVSFHCWAQERRPRPLEHGAATLLTGLVVMLPMHEVAGYRFIVEQLYFVSVVLFVTAIYAWNRRRAYVLAVVILQITFLLNPSLLLAAPLVWLLDDDAHRRLTRFGAFIGVALTSFLLTSLASSHLATGENVDGHYDEFSFGQLRSGTSTVAGNIASSVSDGLATTCVLVGVTIVAINVKRVRPRLRSVYVALPVFAVLWFAAFSVNTWVVQNNHEFRYFYPFYVAFVLFVAAASTELVLAVRPLLPRTPTIEPRIATAVLSGGILVALVVAVVAVRHVRVESLAATDSWVAAAHDYDATLVVGNYWTTWPVVVAGRADGLDLLGVTFRSDPILDEIQSRLDAATRNHESVRVLCSSVDATTCASELSRVSQRDWILGRVVNEEPLVIDVDTGSG